MIDTHLHLWQLGRGWYGWNTPELGEVHRDSELAAVVEPMSAAGVAAAVVVQAADRLAETDWLLDLARSDPRIHGVVGYLPLADPRAVERLITGYADQPLVGVRQLWHDHDDPDELADPEVVASIRLLGEAGLALDVPDAFPRLWPALTVAVDRAPGTRIVVDHCGKPPFADPAGWRVWERGFTDLAGHDNVVIKLSGLFGGRGATAAARPDELARVVELTRTAAGAERSMIGSDWPMTRGGIGYAESLQRLDRLLGSWTPAERAQVAAGTALTVYGRVP